MREDFETYQVEECWMEMVHGTAFTFENPKPEMINIDEIAHSLSRICRYNGHTKRHYSVAEHCILMADWVADQYWASPRDVLTALHHDDAECVIGDLIRPVKHKMQDFKKLENVIDQAMAAKFNTIWPFPEWLHDIDGRIIKDERASVMNQSRNEWGTDELDVLGVKFKHITGRFPVLMCDMFLRRHFYWTDKMRSSEFEFAKRAE